MQARRRRRRQRRSRSLSVKPLREVRLCVVAWETHVEVFVPCVCEGYHPSARAQLSAGAASMRRTGPGTGRWRECLDEGPDEAGQDEERKRRKGTEAETPKKPKRVEEKSGYGLCCGGFRQARHVSLSMYRSTISQCSFTMALCERERDNYHMIHASSIHDPIVPDTPCRTPRGAQAGWRGGRQRRRWPST